MKINCLSFGKIIKTHQEKKKMLLQCMYVTFMFYELEKNKEEIAFKKT